jgi:hypothetical protein
MNTKAAKKLLALWLSVGEEHKGGKARHPEFIYRKTGDWTSWNDFLKIDEAGPSFQANSQQDEIEVQAWQLYQERIKFIEE